MSPVFSGSRQTSIARKDKEHHIALEILCRSISLRLNLRSTVKVPEVSEGQGLYSRFRDSR